MDEIKRALGVRRTFHVDANEVARVHGSGLGHESRYLVAGQFFVHVEAHVGELQADVGVQLLRGDVVQQLVIELGAGSGLVGVGDVFPEIVDGDAQAGFIDRLRVARSTSST